MGNNMSIPDQPMDIKSLSSQIDDIAVHYILKQNTIDLLRLTDKEYYDNLIVLVGNLFEKKLTDMEVGSIHQRIYPETVQDAVLNFLPSNGKIKDSMIRSISKFYMKIMMIFSAIVATIDPQYSYEDEEGNKQLFYLKDFKNYKHIPKHVQPTIHQLTNPMNLCRKRISILRNKIDTTDPDFITINPGEKLCSTESVSHLTDEIGIKELDLLYYDVFDPASKTWKHRSPQMDEKYMKDLKKFYTIFTGEEEMPPRIRSFKDIELFDFRSITYCQDKMFTQDYVIPKDDLLIVRYKEQVDLLEQSTILYRTELLDYMKTLFLTKMDENTMSYTINPSLTMQDILKIESDTRTTIINLYTNCEQYFIRALLIFEELYDKQSNHMNESRLNHTNRGNLPLYKESMVSLTNLSYMRNTFNMTPTPESKQEPFQNQNTFPKQDVYRMPISSTPLPPPTNSYPSSIPAMQTQPSNAVPEPVAMPTTQPTNAVPEPFVMPTTQPSNAVPEPFAMPTTQPSNAVPEPFAMPTTQPSNAVPEPIAMPTTQPSNAVPEPVAMPTTQAQEPFVMPTTQAPEPFVMPTTQPSNAVPEPITMPTTQAPEPITMPTTQAPEPIAMPTTQAPEPIAMPTTQAPEPIAMPTTQAPEPIAMPTTQAPEPVKEEKGGLGIMDTLNKLLNGK